MIGDSAIVTVSGCAGVTSEEAPVFYLCYAVEITAALPSKGSFT